MSPESKYFDQLNAMLKAHDRAIPSLLIDLDILDENIETLRSSIPNGTDFRLVVKSLPSIKLIRYVLDRTASKKLMVFHQPFLNELALHGEQDWDILLGKPMPIKTAAYYYKINVDPVAKGTTVQWLVDTEHRTRQYIELAKSVNQKIKLNLEIDVGLHRGGIASLKDLESALSLIQSNADAVEFSGLMGYDPHVAKIPRMLRSRKRSLELANSFYENCKALIRSKFPDLCNDKLTFNGAGSPTIALHDAGSPLNDISAGSCLVMPTTFDMDTLMAYQPASYIATPVLKKLQGVNIPGLERFYRLLNFSRKYSYFIYGGFWKADYHYPKGIKANRLFGESTNQTMVNSTSEIELEVDDFIFLRPHQSEFVFQHFGKLLVVRNDEIVDEWSPLLNE